MPLISRGTRPAHFPARPLADELERDLSSSLARRRRSVRLLVLLFLALPAAFLLARQGFTGRAIFLVPATGVFIAVVDLVVVRAPAAWVERWAWLALPSVVGLGAATFAVGGMNWLVAFTIAAAAAGRLARSRRQMAVAVATCAVIGLGIGMWRHLSYSNILTAGMLPTLAGLLAFSAERRNALLRRLTETRAELARMAVAEERLRIARDLHDLLGHSLSLIALKAELAGRVIDREPDRAAKEITELEKVARHSLTEVRQAVTGYRQPSLAAELAAARRMLASAGIDCRVLAPTAYSLETAVDALLAWAVREGATNVVRHSGARHAEITIEVTGAHAAVALIDDGARQVADGAADATQNPGSGLAGLAERAASLGATLSAGARHRGGFRLLVTVPLARPHTSGAAVTGTPEERVGS